MLRQSAAGAAQDRQRQCSSGVNQLAMAVAGIYFHRLNDWLILLALLLLLLALAADRLAAAAAT